MCIYWQREKEKENLTHTHTHIKCSNALDFLHLEIVFELAARFSFVVAIYQFYCPLKFTERERVCLCVREKDSDRERVKWRTAIERRNTTCTKRINVISAFHKHPLQLKATIHLEICNYSDSAYLHLQCSSSIGNVQHSHNESVGPGFNCWLIS